MSVDNSVSTLERRRLFEAKAVIREHPEIRAEIEQQLLSRSEEPPVAEGPAAHTDSGPYRIVDGCICLEKDTQHGPIQKPLSNFTAYVKEEIVLDDGAETTRAFVLRGALANGTILPSIRVPAAKFGSMAWVIDYWGCSAIVGAGLSTRDQLREAVQRLSPNPRRREVFTHTGWRKVEADWVFLTASGAVGRDDFEVDLGTELARYALPRVPKNPREAMQASLGLLSIAPLTVTAPLWAAMFRAPVASAYPLDLSLWMAGPTGSLKSTLAALFLSHFGAFRENSLPGSWASTANQLERCAFILKDVPFVIDDSAPGVLDNREIEVKASRLLRSQGNLSARGRLRSDLTVRPGFPPRGIIIGTAEQRPVGHSILARTMLLQFDRSTVDKLALSESQRHSGIFSQAMAGFVEWLAPQMDALPLALADAFESARHRATTGDEHMRVPGNVANLWLGIEYGLRYAEETGAATRDDADKLRSRCWSALVQTGAYQAATVEGERPSRRFVSVLATLLVQGRAVLLERDSRPDSYAGPAALVGWQDDDFLYLLPDASYQAVVRFCRESGEFFPLHSDRIFGDFKREGISDCSTGRSTATSWVGGQTRRILKLRRDKTEELLGEALPGSANYETTETDGTAF